MKTVLTSLFAAILILNLSFGDTKRENYPKHLATLNVSASSSVSYEQAMSNLSMRQPAGYVIESIRYLRVKGDYVVIVKLRRV